LQGKASSLVTEALGLPGEVVFNIPRLVISGNRSMIIENFKGILEYEPFRIRVGTGSGIIKISGKNLVIKHITSEDLMIDGLISSVDFI